MKSNATGGPLRVRMAANGRIVIPAEVRKAAGFTPDEELFIDQDENGVRIQTAGQRIRELQAFASRFKKPGVSIVDELLKERRAEAVREQAEEEPVDPSKTVEQLRELRSEVQLNPPGAEPLTVRELIDEGRE